MTSRTRGHIELPDGILLCLRSVRHQTIAKARSQVLNDGHDLAVADQHALAWITLRRHGVIVAVLTVGGLGSRLAANTIAQFQRENPDRTGLGCHTCPPGIGPHDITEHLRSLMSK